MTCMLRSLPKLACYWNQTTYYSAVATMTSTSNLSQQGEGHQKIPGEIQRHQRQAQMELKAWTTSSSRSPGSGAVERKEVEKLRRQQLKGLTTKLASVIPKQHHFCSKERITQLETLDAAVAYIKHLRQRVDELERKRSSTAQLVAAMDGDPGGVSTSAAMTRRTAGVGSSSEETPVVVVFHLPSDGSILDISLIGGSERPLKLHEVITILEEEGAEVINANISVAGQKIFCTVHSKAFSSRIGIEVSRVTERLKMLWVTY